MRQIPFGRPIIGKAEKNAVAEVLEGPILVHGPKATAFENNFCEFTGGGFGVSVSSCTAALHLCYFHLGLKPGDEVITPAQTHVATAHAVEFCGGKPVFVDAEPDTGNLDIEKAEELINPNTKAISLVHYLGMPVDMDRLMALAAKHGLPVIEDCALAMGTKYKGKHAGLFGEAGCFSFYPVKHMTTAEGGMLLTRHKEWAEAIGRKKAFGVDRHVGERKTPGMYDVNMLGFNYRMNEIQAALGIEQLKRMPSIRKQRELNYLALSKGLREIDELTLFRGPDQDFQSSYYCLNVVLDQRLAEQRQQVITALNGKGVGTSIYYPKPVPHLSYYRDKYGYAEDSFPMASRISYQSIALPVGPHLNEDDMAYIINAFKEVISEVQRV